jgi:hypothetical protein
MACAGQVERGKLDGVALVAKRLSQPDQDVRWAAGFFANSRNYLD